MAESINWDGIYNDYVNQYTTGLVETDTDYAAKVVAAQRKAGELAAYGRLTGSKKDPQKWYSMNEYINLKAPTYRAVRTYKGSDAGLKYLKKALKDLEKDKTRGLDLTAVTEITAGLQQNGYQYQEAYDIANGIYEEFQGARQSYKKQGSSHPYKQYGLPDPTAIYGVTNTTTETYVIDNSGKAVKRKVKVIAYPGASKWIDDKAVAYQQKLVKSGVSATEATNRAAEYKVALTNSVNTKIQNSGITPFVDAAAKRSRTRG
jgi:hypothetical protein